MKLPHYADDSRGFTVNLKGFKRRTLTPRGYQYHVVVVQSGASQQVYYYRVCANKYALCYGGAPRTLRCECIIVYHGAERGNLRNAESPCII